MNPTLDFDDKKNKKRKLTKKLLYCSNCGENGHNFKNCHLPITSYGIINIDISNMNDEELKKLETELAKLKKINGIEVINHGEVEKFSIYKDTVKFLLIRRKHTLGFMEFIRGHYKIDNIEGIIYLFKQMVKEEIDIIAKKDFDLIWNYAWGEKTAIREGEYKASKNRFEKLIEGFDEILNLDFYVKNVKPKWETPEWGFPKGRRNYDETDLECAKREFEEESSIKPDTINILDNYEPFEENFTGTNGILYKHVYFLGLSNKNINISLDSDNHIQNEEIGDIGYFSFYEALEKIRPYHTERIKIITDIYMNIMTFIMKAEK